MKYESLQEIIEGIADIERLLLEENARAEKLMREAEEKARKEREEMERKDAERKRREEANKRKKELDKVVLKAENAGRKRYSRLERLEKILKQRRLIPEKAKHAFQCISNLRVDTCGMLGLVQAYKKLLPSIYLLCVV